MMEIRQTYDIPKIVGIFEKRWGQFFDPTSKESYGYLFKECVFGYHISPQHAMAIVEEAKGLVFTTWSDVDGTITKREISYPGKSSEEHRCVLRTQKKSSEDYPLACD